MFKVKFSHGIYEVPENELDEAISLGGEPLDDNLIKNSVDTGLANSSNSEENLVARNNNNNMASSIDGISMPPPTIEQPAEIRSENQEGKPSATPQKMIKVRYEDGTYAVPENEIEEALKWGGKVVDEKDIPHPEEPESYGKLAARSAKTLESVLVGGPIDTVSALYNIPARLHNATLEARKKQNPDYMGENDFIPVSQQEPVPLIPSATHAINKGIDTVTNDYTKTKEGDSVQAAIEAAGDIFSIGGLAKAAVKGGHHVAGKVLGALGTTKPVGLGAAGAAGYASSEASNAGYGAAGSIGAGLGAGVGAGVLGAAAKTFNAKLALATLTGNSPKNIDLNAVRGAEATGIPYANTIVNESKGLALAEQLVAKAPIIGTKYAKKLDANDKAFASAVENSIKKVGEKIIESESSLDIGSMIKDTFEGVKQSVINEKNGLYKSVNSVLPKDAAIIPRNLELALKKVKKGIDTLKPSDDEASVLGYIKALESKIFSKEILPESKLALSHDLEFKFVPNDKTGKISLDAVPVSKLVGSKVSLNDIIDWDVNASGAKQRLKIIQDAIKEDLKAYGEKNPEWYKQFKEADGFYGKYLGDEALGSDTLRKKIFAQEDPEKIIGSLNKISDFKNLGQSLGRDEAGQKFFESIKREKLSDLIMGKTINPQSEAVSYSGFSKAMENKQNQELVKYLAGDNYKELENFNKYAKAAVRHNQRNPNPSGTASTKTILGAVGGAFTATVAGGFVNGITGGVAPLAATGGLGLGLSWLINNKTALKWGIEAAKKQAAGDYKAVNTYSRRLENAMKKDLGEDFVRQFIALSEQKQQE
jgi:hypothetical protein